MDLSSPSVTRPSPAARPDAAAETSPATDWRKIAALFLGSRILIWAVAGVSLAVVAKGPYFSQQTPGQGWFMRWDAGLYLILATQGYHVDPVAHTGNVNFLPLYPLLVYVGSLGGWLKPWVVGYLVSLACLGGACVWLWKAVARERGDARLATLAVAFLLFGPVSFFFSTLYSESLFLLLAVGSLDSARRGRWWWAGILGALASLTRSIGVILIIPLLWQWFESARRAGRRGPPAALQIAACLLPVTGFLLYCGYLGVRFGDPLAYFHTQDAGFGRHFAWFYGLFARESFSGQALFYQIWFASTVVTAFGLLLGGVLFRIPVAWSVFGLSALCIYVSSRLVESLPRYCSVIFPLYLVLALVARRWPRLALPLLTFSAALLALSVILFVNGYWFT